MTPREVRESTSEDLRGLGYGAVPQTRRQVSAHGGKIMSVAILFYPGLNLALCYSGKKEVYINMQSYHHNHLKSWKCKFFMRNCCNL